MSDFDDVRFENYGGITAEIVAAQMKNVPGYSTLPQERRDRLYRRLCVNRRLYDLKNSRDTTAVPSASARKIGREILQSLRRIADFAHFAERDNATRDAMACIETLAEVWAADRYRRGKLPVQFPVSVYDTESTQSGKAVDHGTSDVLRRFFASARSVYEIAADAHEVLSLANAPAEETAIVDLVGRQLPRVYREAFGQSFKSTRSGQKSGQPHDAPGMLFIRHSLIAIGLDDTSEDTIIKHVKAARSRSASGVQK